MDGALFVTGATGLVGGEVLARHLRARPAARAWVLLRDPSQWPALAARLGAAASRATPVTGDVLEDGLALAPRDRARLAGDVTHVLHAAADTVFSRPLAQARLTNTGGTRHVLALCDEWKRLDSFVYVSTAYVAGCLTGSILEADNGTAAGFVNGYEQSKYEAEALVRAARHPWIIARSATIVSDSIGGGISQLNAAHHTLRLWHAGLVPMLPGSHATPADVVTLDDVARALMTLLDGAATGTTAHLCAGEHALTVGDVLALAWDVWARDDEWRRRAISRPAFVDLATYRLFETTVAETADDRLRRIVRSLGSFAPQLAHPKRFDLRQARAHAGHAPAASEAIWRNVLPRVARAGLTAAA